MDVVLLARVPPLKAPNPGLGKDAGGGPVVPVVPRRLGANASLPLSSEKSVVVMASTSNSNPAPSRPDPPDDQIPDDSSLLLVMNIPPPPPLVLPVAGGLRASLVPKKGARPGMSKSVVRRELPQIPPPVEVVDWATVVPVPILDKLQPTLLLATRLPPLPPSSSVPLAWPSVPTEPKAGVGRLAHSGISSAFEGRLAGIEGVSVVVGTGLGLLSSGGTAGMKVGTKGLAPADSSPLVGGDE